MRSPVLALLFAPVFFLAGCDYTSTTPVIGRQESVHVPYLGGRCYKVSGDTAAPDLLELRWSEEDRCYPYKDSRVRFAALDQSGEYYLLQREFVGLSNCSLFVIRMRGTGFFVFGEATNPQAEEDLARRCHVRINRDAGVGPVLAGEPGDILDFMRGLIPLEQETLAKYMIILDVAK